MSCRIKLNTYFHRKSTPSAIKLISSITLKLIFEPKVFVGNSAYSTFCPACENLSIIHLVCFVSIACIVSIQFVMFPGADPGEVKWVNFHPPFSEPPSFFFIFWSLKYWNNIWFLWHYYKNSPPIAKSWIRPWFLQCIFYRSLDHRQPKLSFWGVIIFCLKKSLCYRSARERRHRDIVTAVMYCYIMTKFMRNMTLAFKRFEFYKGLYGGKTLIGI